MTITVLSASVALAEMPDEPNMEELCEASRIIV